MAFISMLFAGFALIVVLIGICLFGIALLLDLICIIRKCCKKKNHIVLIIFTILFNLGGFVLFVLPVGGILLLGSLEQASSERRFKNAEYKAYVETGQNWREGFTYKGLELVQADFLNTPSEKKLTEEGVLSIGESGTKYYISTIKNESGYEIYYMERVGKLYCDKKDLEAIRQFYYNPDHLTTKINKLTDGETMLISEDFDPAKVFEIRSLYETHGDGICNGTYEEQGAHYQISAYSKDKLQYETVSLCEFENHIVLEWTSGGYGFSAIYLTKELEEYVQSKIYK